MTRGGRPFVPKVDLLDETVEPTDEELHALMASFMYSVKAKAQIAERRSQASFERMLRQAEIKADSEDNEPSP